MLADEFDLPQQSLEKYLPLFARSRAADLEKVQQALSVADFAEISALAHKIKGVAAAFGHAPLGELAVELEQNAHKECLESCQKTAAQLKRYFINHLAVHIDQGIQ